jgi:hypothetical protein
VPGTKNNVIAATTNDETITVSPCKMVSPKFTYKCNPTQFFDKERIHSH